MEEPSLLDYLKALLTPWRGKPPPIPAQVEEEPATPSASRPQPEVELVPPPPAQDVAEMAGRPFPWRSLLALALALFAQLTFEPAPQRTWLVGSMLYLAAFGLLLLAYRRGEWALPQPESAAESDPWVGRIRLRYALLVPAVVLLSLAYLAFGGNRFTTLNVLLWLSGMFCLVAALWQPAASSGAWQASLATLSNPKKWRLTLSPWGLLVLAVVGLVIFFRVYRIDQVPPEMVSDHAEKLLDVWDVLHGQTSIFFPRNTGREAMQFYLTAAVIQLFGTGYTFLSLKIGTVLAGLLTLPFIYLLGKEIASPRVGLLALLLAGIAYWPNVISRVGLRFPLYPLFVAPVLFFLVRGLRRSSYNDFILAGLMLGIGLHGYTPIRILPFTVVAAVGLYLLHPQSRGKRRATVIALLVLSLVSLAVFLPLLRFAIEQPDLFSYRSFTRLGSVEQPLPAPALQIFLGNLWRALTMFAWDDGEIWVHSVTHRPALDVISAAFFYLGVLLVLFRYASRRYWLDLFWLLSVPLLLMPSILSLAFPSENPALNRMAGAVIPVFLIAALSLDSFITALHQGFRQPWGARLAWGGALVLLALSANQNYDLVFNQYQGYYKTASWNTSDMGGVIRSFASSIGSPDTAWVVAYPHWVDTRLVGINAGYPQRDYAISPDALQDTLAEKRARLFLLKPEDQASLATLQAMYPQAVVSAFPSQVEGHTFLLLFVPAAP